MITTIEKRKTKKVLFDNGYKRDIVIRELSVAEEGVMLDVLETALRVMTYKVDKHLQEDLKSFLNEEAYLLACKWDGQGGLRNLGGYIYTNLELYVSNFRQTALLREMKFTKSPEMSVIDEGTLMFWDHHTFAKEDEYTLDGYNDFLDSLTEDQKYILSAVYCGHAMKNIANKLGRSIKHIFNERDRIRVKARKFFGEGFGNGYAKRKNAKEGR